MNISAKEISDLLNGADDDNLYEQANAVKEDIYGKEVYLRAIVEPWNTCRNNCLYCGLRRDNTNLTRFSLDYDEILDAGLEILNYGITSLVLQAGEEIKDDKISLVSRVVYSLKKTTQADITLSFGEQSTDTYKKWLDAGANRYLLKAETMNRQFFEEVHPERSLKDRLACIDNLIKLGYQVGSGFIAGMPGYATQMLAEDILASKDMGIHMFSLSPFISTEDTPWEGFPRPRPDLVHRACAVYRILDPKVNIPVTSAMESLCQGSKAVGLQRGCNVLMHSFTPASVREYYRIYDGKNIIGDEAINQIQTLKNMVTGLGLFITEHEPGRSKKEMSY